MQTSTALVFLHNQQQRAEVVQWLANAGWWCHMAHNKRDMARLYETHNPDVVVLEGPLGSESGADFLHWFRAQNVHTPALLVCGSALESSSIDPELRPVFGAHSLDDKTYERLLAMLGEREERVQLVDEGRLEEFSLYDILLECYRERWTGRILFEHCGTDKTIYWDQGMPVYCSSTIFSENFGQMLMRRKIITEIEYEWARKIQLREGVRQGEALVKIGVFTHQQLFGYLRDQIREKIVNAFGWTEGTFRRESDANFVHNRFVFNPIELMVEGRERFIVREDVGRLWRSLGHLWGVAVFDELDMVKLVHDWLDEEMGARLQTPQPLSELALDLGWSKQYALSWFLVLERAGYLRISDQAETLPVVSTNTLRAVRRATAQHPRIVPPAVAQSPELTEQEHAKLTEDLSKAWLRMTSADHFDALGIDQSAVPAEIMEARDELLEAYSEARFGALLKEEQHAQSLRDIRTKIQHAATTLLHEEKRAAYIHRMSRTHEEGPASVNRYLQAEDLFVSGMEFLDANPAKAREHFALAKTHNPHEAVYEMYYGWAAYQCAKTQAERDKARHHITQAAARNGLLDDGYVFLGKIYLENSDLEEAEAQATTALAFNPGHEGAHGLLREIAAARAQVGVNLSRSG